MQSVGGGASTMIAGHVIMTSFPYHSGRERDIGLSPGQGAFNKGDKLPTSDNLLSHCRNEGG